MSLFSLGSIKSCSISHRIMMAMVALTLVIMVIIAGVSYGFMRHLLKQNVIKTIEQTARQSDQKLELTINSISEEMMRLSLNSLMINALVDTSGSQTYIDPFFKSYKSKGDIAIKITLCDFMGNPIASNVKNPGTYNDPELLRKTISRGMNLGELLKDNNANRILLAYPIVWEMTRKPEGLLVAEISVKELVDKIFPATEGKSKINLSLLSGSRTVFSRINNEGNYFFKFTDKLHLTPPLDQLDLKMEIADYEEINFGWLISVYVLAGIFFLALTIWLSGRLSYFLTTHLRALRSITQKISDSGDLETRAEIDGPAEVKTLAASFNTMIDKLKESRDLLEMRVEERTEELFRVNEQLQDELRVRKQNEEALKESEERFKSLFESAPDAIFVADIESGLIVDANPVASQLLLLPHDKIVGLHQSQLHPPGKVEYVKESFAAHVQEAMGEIPSHPIEITVLCSNGDEISVESMAKMVTVKGKHYLMGIFRNITERKRTEEELKKYREHLETLVEQRTAEALRAKHLASIGELAAGVAHEINNPINSIINYAQILKDTMSDSSKGKVFSDRIMKEGNRIALIVRSLLSFGREIKEEKELIHIRDLMDEMLVLTETQLKKDGISLEMRIAESLPQVIANKQQLLQVFFNLISNARYALNQKCPAMDYKNKKIDIHGEMIADDYVTCARIVFLDNGTGISDDILDKVTNPFFTTKPAGLGTGLGLSISQGIIKGIGGRLSLESKEGEFTRVIIDLPVTVINGN